MTCGFDPVNREAFSFAPSGNGIFLAGACDQDEEVSAVSQAGGSEADTISGWFGCIVNRYDQTPVRIAESWEEACSVSVLSHAEKYQIEGKGASYLFTIEPCGCFSSQLCRNRVYVMIRNGNFPG